MIRETACATSDAKMGCNNCLFIASIVPRLRFKLTAEQNAGQGAPMEAQLPRPHPPSAIATITSTLPIATEDRPLSQGLRPA